jgi:metal-dependent hydrolase (beta-lactamase superfamily II)
VPGADVARVAVGEVAEGVTVRQLETAWGFSCLVKGLDKTILFDTGGDSALLQGSLRGRLRPGGYG